MYAGRVAEIGPVAEVIHSAAAPRIPWYLMGAIPAVGDGGPVGADRRLDAASERHLKGCAFNPRCTKKDGVPVAAEQRSGPICVRRQNQAACWLHAKHQDKVSA